MRLNHLGMTFWVPAGVAGFFLVLAVVFIVWNKPVPLVVVDMTRAIQAPSLMLAQSKHSQEAQLHIMSRFSSLLPEIIAAYGQEHRVTIVSATVLASHNTLDITNEVVSRTIARMKHAS